MSSGYVYSRMLLYFFISILITFGLEIEQLDMTKMHEITFGTWIKVSIKALLPALISIRAYLDNSISNLQLPKINIKKSKP